MLIRSKAKLAATTTDSGKFHSSIALLKQGYINKKKKSKDVAFEHWIQKAYNKHTSHNLFKGLEKRVFQNC